MYIHILREERGERERGREGERERGREGVLFVADEIKIKKFFWQILKRERLKRERREERGERREERGE